MANMSTGTDFIDESAIEELLQAGAKKQNYEILAIIEKAKQAQGLEPIEVAALLQHDSSEIETALFAAASQVKERIYGNRLVMFAPLYISDYCVNRCVYCGYKSTNRFSRKRLSDQEIENEVKMIESLGHKRLVIEAGEDDLHCPIDYILHAIDVAYGTKTDNGHVRRINVNIAATSVDNYRKLKNAGIGTYILFQETYHRATYELMHPSGPKQDYDYHTTAMDRAMAGGIDDVGIGVLFGLYDYKFEVLAMLQHAIHLEKQWGVGPHTISVPRLRAANEVSLEKFPYLVSDQEFKRIVAILRLAVPYTGMIISTREEPNFREEVIQLGISQISAGSCTGVGGYMGSKDESNIAQFEVADHRSPKEIIKSICQQGLIPSYCTACYRTGRTGDRFMEFAKSGSIQNFCHPNALMTFMEYLEDYADQELKDLGYKLIQENIDKVPNRLSREGLIERLRKISTGERDLYY